MKKLNCPNCKKETNQIFFSQIWRCEECRHTWEFYVPTPESLEEVSEMYRETLQRLNTLMMEIAPIESWGKDLVNAVSIQIGEMQKQTKDLNDLLERRTS